MSIFDWNNGKPSILAKLQVHATIAKKSSDKLSTRFRQDPIKVPKKKVRDNSGRTKPLSERIDFDKVREYRMQGNTWRNVAQHFGTCLKSIHEKATSMFPELRHFSKGNAPGAKPMPMPLQQIATEMLAGASLRGSARQHGVSHASLRYRLMQIPAGVEAVRVAKIRSDGVNAAKKAKKRGEVR
jgi:hypothetical protein